MCFKVKQESFIKKLTCTNDVIDCLNRYQEKSNENRIRHNLEPILYKALNYEFESTPEESSSIKKRKKNDDLYEDFQQKSNSFQARNGYKIAYKPKINEIKDISIYYNFQNCLENDEIVLKTSITANEVMLYDLLSTIYEGPQKCFVIEN